MDMDIDQDKLMDFLHRFVGDLGAAMAAGNVVVGDRLGLYRALASRTPAGQRAGRAHRHRNPLRRRVAARPGGRRLRRVRRRDGHVLAHPRAGFTLTDPDGAVYAPGAFQLALGTLRSEPRVTEAFRTGAGIGWHEHDEEVFVGCERFFRPGYIANLVESWLPALDGVRTGCAPGPGSRTSAPATGRPPS